MLKKIVKLLTIKIIELWRTLLLFKLKVRFGFGGIANLPVLISTAARVKGRSDRKNFPCIVIITQWAKKGGTLF
jgi:hypothetical protein